MSSFDLRKFLTENRLTPNTQGYKIIRDETKRVTLKEGALEGDPSTWKQLPSKGSPNRQAWDDLWRTIATYTRDRKLNVRKIINGGGHIRISFKDGSELRIVPGILELRERGTHKKTRITPENADIACEKFDSVGVRHLTFNDPANRRYGAMNHKEVSPLNEAFASKKLQALVNDHDGIKRISSNNPFLKSDMDISKLTDNDFGRFPAECSEQAAVQYARNNKNAVILYFKDGSCGVLEVTKNPGKNNRSKSTNQGQSDDGQVARHSSAMQSHRNRLANNNPEARKDMTRTLSKTRGKYNLSEAQENQNADLEAKAKQAFDSKENLDNLAETWCLDAILGTVDGEPGCQNYYSGHGTVEFDEHYVDIGNGCEARFDGELEYDGSLGEEGDIEVVGWTVHCCIVDANHDENNPIYEFDWDTDDEDSFDYAMKQAEEYELKKWKGAKDGDEELRSLGIIREGKRSKRPLRESKRPLRNPRRKLAEEVEPGVDFQSMAKKAFEKEVFDNNSNYLDWKERLSDYHLDHYVNYYDDGDVPIMGTDFKYPLDDFDVELGSGRYASFSGTIYYEAYEDDDSFDVDINDWGVECKIYEDGSDSPIYEFDWDTYDDKNPFIA